MNDEAKQHEHKYIWQSVSKSDQYSGFNTYWTRVDYYFCEGCLDQKEVVRAESGRECPPWWSAKP